MNITLEDVDTWVLTEYLGSLIRNNSNKGDEFNSKNEEIEDIGSAIGKTRYGNLLDNLPKNYNKKSLETDFNDYRVVYTEGEGTCFIHSFLTSVSNNYRKLSNKEKDSIGKKFRTVYYYNIIQNIDEDNKAFFSNNKSKLLERIKNANIFFEDTDINLFLKIFKLNLLTFLVMGKRATQYKKNGTEMNNLYFNRLDCTNIDDNYDAIIIYNNNSIHFSSIRYNNNKYILPNKKFLEICKKYSPGLANSNINNVTNQIGTLSLRNNIAKGLNGISTNEYVQFLTDVLEQFDRKKYKNTHTYKCISDEIGYILKGGGSKTRKRKNSK